MKRTLVVMVLVASAVLLQSARADASGILFVATDQEEFDSLGLPDRIARLETSGATVVSQATLLTDYFVNGLADGGGFLFAGDPVSSLLHRINLDGTLISTVTAGFPPVCCSEDMAFDPATGILYHGHYSTSIEALDPTTGALLTTYPQDDVVGMAHVGGTLWITKWGARQVGTWDPATNLFTPVFDVLGGIAGMLAWDPFDSILWVGVGSSIRPYDLLGNALGPDYIPFAGNAHTIDGGVFFGESAPTAVPEPTTLLLLGSGLAGVVARARRRSRTPQ
ncbi:MAG: PEP-CTERM sorting domain-containing protein [Vicinamibacterales bacterium]